MRPPRRAWRDRREAGEQLAAALRAYLGDPSGVLVLALPRGGVPVAAPVASALGCELDVLVVRKVGVPWQPELALGAVTASGHRVINDDVAAHVGLGAAEIEDAYRRAQQAAIDRDRLLRAGRPPPVVDGRIVVLVDDGIATGATVRAAADLLSTARPRPAQVVIAVPVGPRDSIDLLAERVDAVVVLLIPEPFEAVGAWYEDFSQVDDDAVRALLSR